MNSLLNDYFDNDSVLNVQMNNLPSTNYNQKQVNLRPSENINMLYRSKLEKSKEDYDFTVQPLKKVPEIKPTYPIAQSNQFKVQNTAIEEEPEIIEPKQKIEPKKNFTPNNKINVEKPHEEIQQESHEQEQEEIREEIQISNEKIEKMQLENDEWTEMNVKSDVLLTGTNDAGANINDVLDEDGNILMYYYDAYEDSHAYPGVVFIFGKVFN